MSMSIWAENEVKLACKKENPDWDEKSFDYGCSCYQSALKAYKSICEDGHSGMSFAITRANLIRLLNELPLTPIEDTEETWNEICGFNGDSKVKTYQCRRMSSLFKNVYEDGTVKFNDNNRYFCIDYKTKDTFNSGFVGRLLDEKFPIKMPYYPSSNKYKVFIDDFISEGYEADNEDYNTRAILYCITPECERVEINRFFAEHEHKMIEITEKEYKERLEHRKEKM